METDLRIPVTAEQKKLIVEATRDEPAGMAAWARGVLLEAARKKKELKMLDDLDKIILGLAYNDIEDSKAKRVTGSRIWDNLHILCPDIAPPAVPAKLNRLISLGLLEKDKANSSSRTKVYAPTDAGHKMWQEIKPK